MANVLSKMNDIVKAPLRYYEERKTRKIYNRVFPGNNDAISKEHYCPNCNCVNCT